MRKLIEDVTTFQRTKRTWPSGVSPKPGHVTDRVMSGRLNFLKEELGELETAWHRDDLAEMGDALVDLIYVAIGTALMMGLPLEEMWDEVQRANMDKQQVGAVGYKGGLIKPDGWKPPQHESILAACGYRREEWNPDENELKAYDGY